MSVGVLLSRFSGLLRDIVFAYFFGVSYVADAFQFAYEIPNLLRKMFGEGALSAAFIPEYKEQGIKKGSENQIRFALNILSLLSVFLLILCLIGILLAPLIVSIIAPGFEGKVYELTTKLTRILLPYLFLIGLSSTLISILNSHNYFFIPALSSMFLNFGMVGSLVLFTLFFETTMEVKVKVYALGVLIGGLMQIIVNLPLLKRVGYRLRINLNLRGDALKKVWQRFIPGVIGLMIRQVNLLADKIIASLLPVGSIAALTYGNRVMQLPLGIIGISVSTAVLPLFSEYVAKKKFKALEERIRFSLSVLSLFMIPMTLIMAVLGDNLIEILFLRGAFDQKALTMSYSALLFYVLGLLFFSVNRTLIPVFYAYKDTKTPVKISAVIVGVNIVLNIILMQFLAHAGLALSTSISALVQMIILLISMKRKIRISYMKVFGNSFRIIIICLVLLPILLSLKPIFMDMGFILKLTTFVGISVVSFIFVFLGAYILKFEYFEELKKILWKRLQKK